MDSVSLQSIFHLTLTAHFSPLKVISARDGDHSSAWENYIQLVHKESSISAIDDQVGGSQRKALLRDRHDLGRRTKHEIYSSPPRRRLIRKDRPKTHGSFDAMSIVDGNGPPETKCCNDDRTDSVLSASYQEEAKKLLSVKRSKDRLRGHYLLYDIPNGLDDTVARFIMTVTLRYDFENPGDSSVSGNCHSARPEKGHLQTNYTAITSQWNHLHTPTATCREYGLCIVKYWRGD